MTISIEEEHTVKAVPGVLDSFPRSPGLAPAVFVKREFRRVFWLPLHGDTRSLALCKELSHLKLHPLTDLRGREVASVERSGRHFTRLASCIAVVASLVHKIFAKICV